MNMNDDPINDSHGVRVVVPCLMPLIAGCLLLSLAACGAPVSEKASGQPQSASKGETAGAGVVVGAAQRGSESGNAIGSSSQSDRKAVSAGLSASDTEERDNRLIPGVPDMVVRDLGSADPRDRYRALEHWNVKGGSAPLDPVFEAMEDEDEDVREKATAIVEQRWAEEQKREQG
jgi:hypothetical protein